ncbi:MAG: hypothetical protein HZA06_05945 [Nitrospirae bacterium]|nr:hypothetical protein [Nitrospirota bacterium]
MNKNGFIEWLIEFKHMGSKSARDVVSRCGRVEKIFGISFQDSLVNLEDVELVLRRLELESGSYLHASTKSIYAVAVLKRAVRLYYEYYKSSK